MGWKDRIEDAPTGGWRDRIVDKDEGKPSKLESAGRGLAQGFTFGWGDELSALFELGLGKITGNEAYKDASYTELRDQNRAIDKEAKAANPKLYGASEIAGSLPGMIATAGKASSIGALAGIGAAQGGAMAAGSSENKGLGLVADTAIGTGIGGALGAAVPAASKGISSVGKWLKPKKIAEQGAKTARKIITDTLGNEYDEITHQLVRSADDIAKESAEQAAKTESQILTEQSEDAVKKAVKPIEILEADKSLARMGDKDVNVVAYARNRGGEKVISEAPSLDSNAVGNLRHKFGEALETVRSKLDDYENTAGELIENSGLELSNGEIAESIQGQIKKLATHGKMATKPGKVAMRELKSKLSEFIDKDGNVIPGKKSAKWIRQYLQGLREENKSFFNKIKTGQSYGTVEKEIQGLSASMDNILKTRIPGYEKAMAPYSKAMRAYSDVRRSMGRQTVADFFSNKVMKPIENSLYGTRALDEKWAKTLIDFGEAAGDDFISLTKDRLAYGHLFPQKVTSAESPSFGQAFRNMAHGAMKAQYNPLGVVVDATQGVAGPVSKYIKAGKFERGLQRAVAPVPPGPIGKVFNFGRNIAGTAMEGTGKGIQYKNLATYAGIKKGIQAKSDTTDKDAAIKIFNDRYAPVLESAEKRGGSHSVAVTNYLLHQQDPEYRRVIKRVYEDTE